MSLITQSGRRQFRSRMAVVILYVLLGIGAIITLYPFLTMLLTGTKGPTDQTEFSILPKFWYNQKALFEKYIHDKYAGNLSLIDSTRTGTAADQKLLDEYKQFLKNLPEDYWTAGFGNGPGQVTSKLSQRYQNWLRSKYKTIEKTNSAYLEENVVFQSALPPSEMLERKAWKPISGAKADDWNEFKRTLPTEYRIPITERRMFQEHLRSKTKNQIELVSEAVRLKATKFEDIALPESGIELDEFRKEGLPSRYVVRTVESLWNKNHTWPMPIAAYEADYVKRNAGKLRLDFTFRNYSYVLDYILLHGKAVFNTAVFCGLALLLQLTINPLAAYILSRYPIRATGKILIFLLATMAFPAEVTMIPSFLLLKDLGLLNTFAALALPTAASGYMIFLLKGFFDSLPQEIYESGQMDGAKEMTLLTRIALPLSRPVLGYVGLLTFMGAYSAFMYAFLVAQDQKMWTLMVWIYELQIHAPKAVMMAALALVAVPTILVFMFAQKTISKGMVLPGER
jgi:multiple sugar transport system permease protein